MLYGKPERDGTEDGDGDKDNDKDNDNCNDYDSSNGDDEDEGMSVAESEEEGGLILLDEDPWAQSDMLDHTQIDSQLEREHGVGTTCAIGSTGMHNVEVGVEAESSKDSFVYDLTQF